MDDDPLLGLSEVAEYTKLSVNTLYSYRSLSLIPPPDQIFGTSPAWRQSTIEQWLRDRETVRAARKKLRRPRYPAGGGLIPPGEGP